MNINLSLPDEVNDERKKLGATWREIITAGINVIKGNPNILIRPSAPKIDTTSVEAHLKTGLKGITEAWKEIQSWEISPTKIIS